jgi:hypothetical protein
VTFRHHSAPILVFGFAILVCLPSSRADEMIPAGFDYLSTVAGTYVNVPGVGPVPLLGNPNNLGLYNSDTIVERLNGADVPDTLGATATVNTEMTKLSLESTAPVNIGGSFFDVFVELNPNTATLGQLTLTQTVNGEGAPEGTFTSFFDVFFDLTLHPIGGGADIVTPMELPLTGSGFWTDDPGSPFVVGNVNESDPPIGVHIATEVPEVSSVFLLVTALACCCVLLRRTARRMRAGS